MSPHSNKTKNFPNRGIISAICLVHHDITLHTLSAIDKRPVDHKVFIDYDGLAGDHVVDKKHHGGVEQAVYAYSQTEAESWSASLERELPPGWFGENLRLNNMPVTDLLLGQRIQLGTGAILEATLPREPCRNFAIWSGEHQWVKRFAEQGDTGAYFKVITPGSTQAGEAVYFINSPTHSVRLRDIFYATPIDQHKFEEMTAILRGEHGELAPRVRRILTRKVQKS